MRLAYQSIRLNEVSSGKIKTIYYKKRFVNQEERVLRARVFEVMRSAGDSDFGAKPWPAYRATTRKPEPAAAPRARSRRGRGRYGLAPTSRGQTSNRCPLNRHQHRVETPTLLKMFHYTIWPTLKICPLSGSRSISVIYLENGLCTRVRWP